MVKSLMVMVFALTAVFNVQADVDTDPVYSVTLEPGEDINSMNDILEDMQGLVVVLDMVEKGMYDVAVDCNLDLVCMHDKIQAFANDPKDPTRQVWMDIINEAPSRDILEKINQQCDVPAINDIKKSIVQCLAKVRPEIAKKDINSFAAIEMAGQCVEIEFLKLANAGNPFAMLALADMDDKSKDWVAEFEARMMKNDQQAKDLAQCSSSILRSLM